MPKSWADLLKPEYKNKVALNGSPLTSGSAFAGVFSAALANGGSLDNISPGSTSSQQLKTVGQLHPGPGDPADDRLGPDADHDRLGLPATSPTSRSSRRAKIDGRRSRPTACTARYYCQAINATAPHPYAARLWQEFLYSDQGQLLWLKGYSHPARFADMAKRKVIPKALLSGAADARRSTRT